MKRHSKIYSIVCLLDGSLAAMLINAAPLPVRSVQKDASGVTMQPKSGVLRLEVWEDRTIHVIRSPRGKPPEKREFVVSRQWLPTPFQWREEPSQFILRTERMGVSVNRATGALTFVDAALIAS
jgi:alpha-D-xyloside xylohydrolase